MTHPQIIRLEGMAMWSEQPPETLHAPNRFVSFNLADALTGNTAPDCLHDRALDAWQLVQAGFRCALVVARNTAILGEESAKDSATQSVQFHFRQNTPEGQTVYLGPAAYEIENQVRIPEDTVPIVNFGFWLPRPFFVTPNLGDSLETVYTQKVDL